MEYIPGNDRYYDPPEEPEYGPCDSCGEVFDNGDLNHIGHQWICDDCLRREEQKDDDQ